MAGLGARFREVRLALLAWGLVLYARVGLSILGYRKLARHLPQPGAGRAPVAYLQRLRRRVTAAARYVPNGSCLPQAIAGQMLLSWRGYRSEIHLGVRAGQGGGLAAHAWLTSDDVVVVGDLGINLEDYAHLTVLRAAET